MEVGKSLDKLLQTNQWILQERRFFGQPNTNYDFSKYSVEEIHQNHSLMKTELSKLGEKINKKVLDMYDKVEKQYYALEHKKSVVDQDKEKIERVIRELDNEEEKTIKKAWNEVNKDLGSIFTSLLPGAKAKLVEPEGLTFMTGLEIKVSFGCIWKPSLSELSGGQRSVLALSLILALARLKPSPIYILDEIDAALDLCHTQNISQMIKEHFSQTQFIVVSLKETMFYNANVVFRIEYIDGVSLVRRMPSKD